MASLPMNRTRLNAAIANQQPSIIAASLANREAHLEAADTIDLLNQKVDGLVAGGTLQPNPAARVYHNANQSIASATLTTLAFNSERFDTNTMHDNVTNNSRLTCKTVGVYSISATLQIGSSTTGSRELYFQFNGSTLIAGIQIPAIVDSRLSLGTIYQLAVDDYVELLVRQDSGVSLNVSFNGNYSPEFMMVKVG